MINEHYARKFCKDDISLIENYDKAIADNSHTWHCHHRDEVRILPSGMVVHRSREELIENDRYYNCPANELIFLTKAEHTRLHTKGKQYTLGKHHSDKTRRKISAANKGKNNKFYGKHHSAETKKKICDAMKACWAIRRQQQKQHM